MKVPRCQRGNHWCAELCEVAHGQACKPPEGSAWRPRGLQYQRGSAASNYRELTDALQARDLTEVQQRYLRWLAGWDADTAEAVASLFRAARAGKGQP